jgi:EAL domain-containing protein (putative c-di-GMP-specific phosphodiesterase class I)
MERVELETELRHALLRDELFVVYQPCIDLQSETIVGVEALVRWRHPRLGMVAPDRFIRIAEESGQILAIGDHVLRQACAQYRQWRHAGLELQHLAVNVSVRQLQAPGFAQSVRDTIAQNQIPAGVLEIEITESVFASDIVYLTAVLNELHAMQVRIAIDDFGTGYSSLSYLRKLPIDTLKVDRSFLPVAGDASDAATLCAAILAMGQALRMTVVAEGVETQEQVQFLKAHGCELVQGYYFSRPESPQDIVQRYGPLQDLRLA